MNALIYMFLITYGIYALFNNMSFWFIYIILIAFYYYFTQVLFFKTPYLSTRRKLMVATWGALNDPQIYAKLKLDITKIEPYLLEKSKEIGDKITLTVYIIKLLSIVLNKYPQMQGYIKFGKFNEKDTVDICCLVQVGDGQDLANKTLKMVEQKDFKEICSDLNQGVVKLRNKMSQEHNKKMQIINVLPTFLIGPIFQITCYISSIGKSIKFLGLTKNEFGSCVVTSIGTLGIEDGYPPIPPTTFVPLLVSICKKQTENYYNENHEIQERSTVKLNFTIDQRFIDANIAENITRDLKSIGENPDIFEREMNKTLKIGKDKKQN